MTTNPKTTKQNSTQSSTKAFSADGYPSFAKGIQSAIDELSPGTTINSPTGLGSIIKANPSYYDSLYLQGGFIQKVIDLPVQDAFRNGRSWNGSDVQNTAIRELEQRLNVQDFYRRCVIAARLRGGCAGYIHIEGHGDISEPVDYANVKPEQIRYLELIPTEGFDIQAIDVGFGSPTKGQPVKYMVRNLNVGATNSVVRGTVEVDRTRLMIFRGKSLPLITDLGNVDAFWGYSHLDSLAKGLESYRSSVFALHALLMQAKRPNLYIPGLSDALEDGETDEADIAKTVATMSKCASMLDIVPLDGDYRFELNQTNFTGIPEAIETLRDFVSGETGIPSSKLFGISTAGLSNTDAGPRKNYQDLVKGIQEEEIRPATAPLDRMIANAAGSGADKLGYAFNALETPTDEEKAETFNRLLDGLTKAVAAGIITPADAKDQFDKINPNTSENS